MLTAREKGPLVPKLRFPGDTQYFENYEPQEQSADSMYPDDMLAEYDHIFRDF
jgi:hypothetical protein